MKSGQTKDELCRKELKKQNTRIYNIGAVEVLEEKEREIGLKSVSEAIIAENTDEKHQTTDFGSTTNPK